MSINLEMEKAAKERQSGGQKKGGEKGGLCRFNPLRHRSKATARPRWQVLHQRIFNEARSLTTSLPLNPIFYHGHWSKMNLMTR